MKVLRQIWVYLKGEGANNSPGKLPIHSGVQFIFFGFGFGLRTTPGNAQELLYVLLLGGHFGCWD